MPGQPRSRLRREALEAAARAAELQRQGDPGAAAAVERAGKLAEALREYENGRLGAKLAIDPRAALPKGEPIATVAPPPPPCRLPEPRQPVHFTIAASLGTPDALGDDEFVTAASVVSAVSGADICGAPDTGEDSDGFLAWAFPNLLPEERVRAARYLASLAKAELRPTGSRSAAADHALESAGLPYTAFEAMCRREDRFRVAVETLVAARRRAVMNMLEESLLERAFDGYRETQLTRDGPAEIHKYDNKLAFDLLRYNHDHYVKVGKGEGGGVKGKHEGGMTLMIANGVGQLPEPKRVRTLEMEGR